MIYDFNLLKDLTFQENSTVILMVLNLKTGARWSKFITKFLVFAPFRFDAKVT